MKLKHVLWIGTYILAAWLNGCGAEAAFALGGPHAARSSFGVGWSSFGLGIAAIGVGVAGFSLVGLGLSLLGQWAKKRR